MKAPLGLALPFGCHINASKLADGRILNQSGDTCKHASSFFFKSFSSEEENIQPMIVRYSEESTSSDDSSVFHKVSSLKFSFYPNLLQFSNPMLSRR